MTVPSSPRPSATRTTIKVPSVDNEPPTRSRVSGILAVVACCALPLLIAVGVLTTAGAAIVEKTLFAVSAGLVVLAQSM